MQRVRTEDEGDWDHEGFKVIEAVGVKEVLKCLGGGGVYRLKLFFLLCHVIEVSLIGPVKYFVLRKAGLPFGEVLGLIRGDADGLESEEGGLFVDHLKPPLLDGGVVDRGEEGVYDDFHHLVNHLGEESLDEGIGGSQVRVVVDLQQPDPKVFIKYEVVSEQLELFLLARPSEKFLN